MSISLLLLIQQGFPIRSRRKQNVGTSVTLTPRTMANVSLLLLGGGVVVGVVVVSTILVVASLNLFPPCTTNNTATNTATTSSLSMQRAERTGRHSLEVRERGRSERKKRHKGRWLDG